MSEKPNAPLSGADDLLAGVKALLEALRPRIASSVGYMDRDVEHRMHEQATLASARYGLERMPLAAPIRQRKHPGVGHYELLEHALLAAPAQGFVAEFGVAKGDSLAFIANLIDRVIYGFDSFEGLPEPWSAAVGKGAFTRQGRPPEVAAILRNFRLVQGLFKDSLPAFLEQVAGPAAFLHLDCYTYSSTRDVLDALEPRIVSGTVIVLRQYFNFPGWEAQQFRAFQEFATRSGKTYRYLAYTPAGTSVSLVID